MTKLNVNHSTFGGSIYRYDFDAHLSISDLASRITSDLKFDEQCRKNIKRRERMRAYENNSVHHCENTY